MKAVYHLILILVLLMQSSCTSASREPLRIGTNLWIGYTPLFYANERGWLAEGNIRLINAVSLYESMQMFAVGNTDAFTGTQYEYHVQRRTHPSLLPVILLDRSRGGDIIMSNRDLDTLRKSDRPVDVWLEVDSVSQELFKAFVRAKDLEGKKYRFHNLDPESISELPLQKTPAMLVTYEPYDDPLRSRGYRELCNSADPTLHFQIIDALYVPKEVLENRHKELAALNRAIARALRDLHKDPRAFYGYIKNYLHGEDYAHFRDSMERIEWIYGQRRRPFLEKVQALGLPVKSLMEPANAL